MKKIVYFLITTIVLSACKKENTTAEKFYLTANIVFSDIDNFPKKHNIHLELYTNKYERFPELTFAIDKPNQTNISAIKIEIKPEQFGEYIIKLSMVENATKKIELLDYGAVQINKNINLSKQTVRIATFTRIKNEVFKNCTFCHGENPNRIAANLNLLPDSAFANLVNIKALKSDMLRVKPLDTKNSFIIKVLRKEIDFEHSASTNVWDIQNELIENWILEGAKND